MKDTVISITDTLVGLALVAMILITIMAFEDIGFMAVIAGCIATSVFAGLWCVLSRINDSLKSLVKIQDAIYNKLNKDE